eukprot:CAMPEP_0179280918 /NCGR_PEP_ID=MMETSP0797-20121207/36877_1 /TAXON_ID=47934 /ORGANISM="Dinophysis acuminata, Strain DAEP01" /LENGTH=481 /DNA_ID=CAMNT_0020989593 /DNA_START=55 /DNA_END=1498 /DNA_ORIENTATION=+
MPSGALRALAGRGAVAGAARPLGLLRARERRPVEHRPQVRLLRVHAPQVRELGHVDMLGEPDDRHVVLAVDRPVRARRAAHAVLFGRAEHADVPQKVDRVQALLHAVPLHLRDGALPQQPLAAVREPPAREHANEAGCVGHCADEAAVEVAHEPAAREDAALLALQPMAGAVPVDPVQALPRGARLRALRAAIKLLPGPLARVARGQAAELPPRHRPLRVAHAQRPEDPLLKDLVHLLARDELQHVRQYVEGIAVIVGVPGLITQGDLREVGHEGLQGADLLPHNVLLQLQVPLRDAALGLLAQVRRVADARGVAHQVSQQDRPLQGHRLVAPRAQHRHPPERRDVLVQPVLRARPALLDEREEGRADVGLGGAVQPAVGAEVEGRPALHVREAVGVRLHHLPPAVDDARAPRDHAAVDDAVDGRLILPQRLPVQADALWVHGRELGARGARDALPLAAAFALLALMGPSRPFGPKNGGLG